MHVKEIRRAMPIYGPALRLHTPNLFEGNSFSYHDSLSLSKEDVPSFGSTDNIALTLFLNMCLKNQLFISNI